jgi:cation diffusion facilitator family transporter
MSKETEESELKFYEKPSFINIILLIVNSLLFVLKLVFSIYTNSLALQADAFDNLTDIVMVITSLIGIIYTNKKPNEQFPYGYYRMENIISLVISIFIFFTAYTIIRDSISEIFNFFQGDYKTVLISPLIMAVLIISIGISALTTLYLIIIGKKASSEIIKSEAKEKLLDNFISLTVLFSFIGAYFNIFILDSLFGLIIAIFIIKGGYDIFMTSTKTLLDAVINFEKKTELYELIESFPKVKSIDNLEIRAYGKYNFLEADLELSKDLALSKVDLLKRKLSNQIQEQFPEIFKIVITTRAQKVKRTKIAVPLEDNDGLDSNVYERYGEAPFFGLVILEDNELIKFEILKNEYIDREKRKGILVSDWLSSQNIDKVYNRIKLKKGPGLVFENSFIEAKVTNRTKLRDIVVKEEDASL